MDLCAHGFEARFCPNCRMTGMGRNDAATVVADEPVISPTALVVGRYGDHLGLFRDERLVAIVRGQVTMAHDPDHPSRHTEHVDPNDPQMFADARLLAESPALLAALVTARWYVYHVTHTHTPVCDCDPCRELRAIDAVIARASGAES